MKLTVMFQEYEWNTQTRSTILSSFFWGYVVMQVPAGMLGQRFGPKLFLMGAMAVCSIFNMLTPLAAKWGGWGLVCACRIIQGLSQDNRMGIPARIFPKLVDGDGIPSFNNAIHRDACESFCLVLDVHVKLDVLFQAFVFPSTHNILPMWSTPEERGRFATWTPLWIRILTRLRRVSGSQFGTILAMPICGALAQSAAGWPSVFYLFGGVGLLWCVLWFFLGADSPASHKWISQEEKLYIEASLAKITSSDKNWGFWTLLTEMPTYMSSVLNFNISENSLLSALPYLMMWIMSFIMSWAADLMEARKTISLTVSRKLFNSIAHWGPAVALIGLGYSRDTTLAVGLLTAAVAANAGVYVGFQVNHIDLSPNYAGTMMGITNCVANIMSIMGPLMVGVIVHDDSKGENLITVFCIVFITHLMFQTLAAEWKTVFFIAACIYFLCNLFFVLFGSAVVQPWNEPETSDEKSSKQARSHHATKQLTDDT
uniref:Inorganic phosphate cotransporter n=1 Tax=Timema monikensis TaxID=170555 RepID=A0A7R9E3L6_9NEOP|nr:unnamed protein product [Timema monikensis]